MNAPKIKRIWVKYGRDFSLPHIGKDDKAEFCITLEAEVADDQLFPEIMDDLWKIARLSVRREFDRLPKPLKEVSIDDADQQTTT